MSPEVTANRSNAAGVFRLFVSLASSTGQGWAQWMGKESNLITSLGSSVILSERVCFHILELFHRALLHSSIPDKLSGPQVIYSDLLRAKGECDPALPRCTAVSLGWSGPGLPL